MTPKSRTVMLSVAPLMALALLEGMSRAREPDGDMGLGLDDLILLQRATGPSSEQEPPKVYPRLPYYAYPPWCRSHAARLRWDEKQAARVNRG